MDYENEKNNITNLHRSEQVLPDSVSGCVMYADHHNDGWQKSMNLVSYFAEAIKWATKTSFYAVSTALSR